MMMATGLPGRNSAHPKQTLHPAGEQTVGQESPRLTALQEEEASATATLIGTESNQEVLLTNMVKTGPVLLTEVHPRQMRRTAGAESPLSLRLSVSLVVLTVAALLELHTATVATDGPGDLCHLQQLTAQPQQRLQSAAV